MVLNDASPTSSDFANESESADNDSTTSSSSGAGPQDLPSFVNLATLPRPLPVFGPMFGFTDERLKYTIGARVHNYSAIVLKRPLSRDEWEGLSYHLAKQFSIMSFGTPTGIMAGWLRAESTKAEFRFPFFKPDMEKFNPHRFPFTSLRGQAATSAWHWLRRLCYVGAGTFVTRILVGTYAASVVVVGMFRDPRLADIRNMVVERQQESQKQRQAGVSRDQGQMQPEDQQAEGVQQQQRRDEDSSQGYAWSRVQQASKHGRSLQQSSSGGDHDPLGRNDESRADKTASFFDDASPTAGNEPLTALGSPRPSPNETSWDRVRGNAPRPQSSQGPRTTADAWARARGGNPTESRREQEDHSGSQDSFRFSEREEEGQLAKSEAQRDFDARIERERQGQDFSEDSKQHGGWRN